MLRRQVGDHGRCGLRCSRVRSAQAAEFQIRTSHSHSHPGLDHDQIMNLIAAALLPLSLSLRPQAKDRRG